MINVVGISFLGGALASLIACITYITLKKRKLQYTAKTTQELVKKTRENIEQEKKEAFLKLKDELHKRRSDFELEAKKTQIESQRLQHKYQKREDTLEQRELMLDDIRNEQQRKERELAKRLDQLNTDETKLKKIYQDLVNKLEKISVMTREEAKKVLFESLQEEVKLDSQKWLTKVEEESRLTAKDKASEILCTAMQRYLVEQVTLHSSSVIHLPNEEMKGRIIGKEGRNIKALEMATGMEFVIGETPEVITISGFNPIRREIAKRALNKLIQDGRINPTRIEETVQQCEEELDSNIEELGQNAILEFDFVGMHPELIKLVGALHFRTSYTQNNLSHSIEVAHFSRMIASELGVSTQIASRAGLLHDIGKAVSAEVEGPHALVGADLAKKHGENSIIVDAIASHHDDISHKSIYGIIIHLADAISASRPGARKETLAAYIKRLEQLEEIANDVEGVKKAYALQAGREIRVIVEETTVDDAKALQLARDLAKRIEEELSFPGQIKVNVIREKRIIEYAK